MSVETHRMTKTTKTKNKSLMSLFVLCDLLFVGGACVAECIPVVLSAVLAVTLLTFVVFLCRKWNVRRKSKKKAFFFSVQFKKSHLCS